MHIGEKMQTVSKKALDKQMVAAQKAADAYWGKDANGKQMTREDAFKKIHQQRDEFNKQNDSEAFAVKYDKEVYQPAIAACHKQSEECYEVAFKKIHQQRDEFNKQNDSEAFAVKYDKEVYQPAIAACHKQSEECYEVPIQQKRDFDINEQRRQTLHVINRVKSVMKCRFSRNEISISTNNGDRLFCNHKNLAVNCRMTG